VIDAVLFDWGNTLAPTEWSDGAARAGNELGLAAIGREGLPAPEAIEAWWGRFLTSWEAASPEQDFDTVAAAGDCFTELGCPLEDDEVARYVEATQRYWTGLSAAHPQTHLLLDRLRAEGLELGLVSNTTTPKRFLDEALESQGLGERLGTAVFSRELGKRKPHPAIFEAALEALGVAAERTVFVGDRSYEDVHGAAAVGMTTVQALWFGAVDDPRGAEPAFRATEPLDVLDIVRTLRRRAA